MNGSCVERCLLFSSESLVPPLFAILGGRMSDGGKPSRVYESTF